MLMVVDYRQQSLVQNKWADIENDRFAQSIPTASNVKPVFHSIQDTLPLPQTRITLPPVIKPKTINPWQSSEAPPNFPLQVEGDSVTGSAVAPPSSWHRGGVHVLFCDGSTDFITDAIESGDLQGASVRHGMTGELAPGSKSPYGIWGALGTRASND